MELYLYFPLSFVTLVLNQAWEKLHFALLKILGKTSNWNRLNRARFEVLTSVLLKLEVFRNVSAVFSSYSSITPTTQFNTPEFVPLNTLADC
jgi:hypothetical protein